MTVMKVPCILCDPTGRGRSCAPKRCYCAHEECHAYASWAELPAVADITVKTPTDTSWDNRTHATWLDQ